MLTKNEQGRVSLTGLTGGDIYSVADGLAFRARAFCTEADRAWRRAERDEFDIAVTCYHLTFETWTNCFGKQGPDCGVVFPDCPVAWGGRS